MANSRGRAASRRRGRGRKLGSLDTPTPSARLSRNHHRQNCRGGVPCSVLGIKATAKAFAALLHDGTVVAWGDAAYGGLVPNELGEVDGTVALYSNKVAFVARKYDGSLRAWGPPGAGGEVPKYVGALCPCAGVFAIVRAAAPKRPAWRWQPAPGRELLPSRHGLPSVTQPLALTNPGTSSTSSTRTLPSSPCAHRGRPAFAAGREVGRSMASATPPCW